MLDQSPLESLSSVSSIFSSPSESSAEYDTPGTSAAATPAAFYVEGRKARVIRGGNDVDMDSRATKFGAKTPSKVSSGKRKRTPKAELDEQQFDSDTRLAQALQAEEYGEAPAVRAKTSKGHRLKVEDSEESDCLSDIISDPGADTFDYIPSVEADRPILKKAKTEVRTSLPTRAARDVAMKSIAEKALIGIIDDEDDDSELSDYQSDMDSDVDLSEFDDVEGSPNLADTGIDMDVAAAINALPRRRRRTLPNATAGSSRRHSRQAILTSRVSLKH